MKKTILLGLGLAAIAAVQSASAQGYINVNNYDASVGLFLGSSSVQASATLTYVELLGGSSSTTVGGILQDSAVIGNNQLAIFTPSSVSGGPQGNGTFFDNGAGPVTGVQALGTGYFQFIAWVGGTGSSTLSGATSSFISAVWSQAVGTAASAGPPPTPGSGVNLLISKATPVNGLVVGSDLVMTPVPEPTTLALAGLGGFGMLMALRRKQA